MQSYYDILGIKRKASQQEIRSAYRELIKRFHPDINPNSAEATKRTQQINEAYSVLKDPVRRYEYDSLSAFRSESESASPKQESSQRQEKGAPTEIPHYECETCGRQDPTLRVTIFLWVLSLFIVTWKRGWGKILCSRCRIKYSLLWNAEVWVAGWWGFPYGPIYSIEALFKNSKGGVQPEENNASLLSVLAYDFYSKGRYNEAYVALQNSQRIKSTKEGVEFLNHLAQYVKAKEAVSPLEWLTNLHPAFYNVPFLILFLYCSFLFLSSGNMRSSTSSATSEYVPTVQNPPIESEPITPGYVALAPKFGINVAEVERSGRVCNEAIANVATHIRSRVPYKGSTEVAGTTIHHYELDRDKLDEKVIHPFTEQIYLEMLNTSALLKRLTATGSATDPEEEKVRTKLRGFLSSQYRAMVASYFNSAILEVSIPIVNQFYVSGVVPAAYSNEVFKIGTQTDVAAWLARSRYDTVYEELVRTILSARSSRKTLGEMESELNTLKSQIDEDESTIQVLRGRLDTYESAGMTDEYNELVPTYNSSLADEKWHIQKHDDLVKVYNRTIKSASNNNLDGAFNDCLDPRILFASFEQVDLKSSRRSTSIKR